MSDTILDLVTSGARRRRPGRVIAALAAVAVAGGVTIAAQQRIDRSKPPSLGPAPALRLPPIQKTTLSNGVPVWIVESHEVPLVQVTALLRAGANDDPRGKDGVASLTAAMLDEGAGRRSALEIADAIDVLGGELSTSSGFDASAVRVNVPVAQLAEALPVMGDVVLRPTFPQAELERLREELITALIQARDDPASVVPRAFERAVFGETHRYGAAAVGTIASVKGLTIADLRSFHEARYRPANAVLLVVGDVRRATVLPLLEKQFGGWKAGTAPARRPVPVAPALTERQVMIVDVPGAAQSQIRIGAVGVARATPDYFTLQVLNTMLGGSFTSRLNLNLREEHQYTYGASSRFDMRLSPGAFAAGAGVQTDKTAEALKEFFNELEGIAKPADPEELRKAKNYITLGLPSEFETIGDLSGHLEQMVVYGLPDDYYDRYAANIQAVSADAVARAAATYIQPRRLAVVVVGDRKVIEPGIRALNLGPVRTLTVTELLGP